MIVDIQYFCDVIKKNIDELVKIYQNSHEDFFFTEKELHSYFYHLCLNSKIFITESGFNLIHTEYPTPFKCKMHEEKYIVNTEISDNSSIRSHIDFVVLNPNFVNWILRSNMDTKYISGLSNILFSKYIVDFSNIYNDFQKKYNEPILLFAIEFKYIRHDYSGTKYPKNDINYDIAKLDLIKDKNLKIGEKNIHFCLNTLSLVFIGHRIKGNFENFINVNNGKDCMIIKRKK